MSAWGNLQTDGLGHFWGYNRRQKCSYTPPFLEVYTNLEVKSRIKEDQYLQREVTLTPPPTLEIIFVPHIIPNNLAHYCSTQLRLYEKLQLGHKTAALPQKGGCMFFNDSWGVCFLTTPTVKQITKQKNTE